MLATRAVLSQLARSVVRRSSALVVRQVSFGRGTPKRSRSSRPQRAFGRRARPPCDEHTFTVLLALGTGGCLLALAGAEANFDRLVGADPPLCFGALHVSGRRVCWRRD
jgi:hypothetical protein